MDFSFEWRVEARPARSVIVGGKPRRVAFSQPNIFLVSRALGVPWKFSASVHVSRHGPVWLHAWAFAGEPGPNTELLISPFYAVDDGLSHVYSNGMVCFNETARDLVRDGMDPVDMFWGSNMRVLPKWLTRPPSGSRTFVTPAESQAATRTSAQHAHPSHSKNEPVGETTELAPGNLLRSLQRGEAGSYYTDHHKLDVNGSVYVRAPWLPREEVSTVGRELDRLRQAREQASQQLRAPA